MFLIRFQLGLNKKKILLSLTKPEGLAAETGPHVVSETELGCSLKLQF